MSTAARDARQLRRQLDPAFPPVRTRDLQRSCGLSRQRFAAAWLELAAAGAVMWTPSGWEVTPRRARRVLGNEAGRA